MMKQVVVFFIALLLLMETAFAVEVLTPPMPEIECIKLTKNLEVASTTKDKVTFSEITLLQKFLSSQGYFHSAPTGTFGKATLLAVKAYQKSEKLPVTGKVGPLTRKSISVKNCGKIASTTPEVISKGTSSITLPSSSSKKDSVSSSFSWNFRGNSYEMSIPLSQTLYTSYSQSPKVYSYKGKLPDNWTEEYNTMFLEVKPDDYTFDTVASAILSLARRDGMSNDDTVNFALSFAQSVPYDFSKDIKKDHTQYPYETLFTKKGVCADKTFLAYQLLKRLGYGVAILQYLDINHQAVGVKCPTEDSVDGSGYCYAETTNYLPVGMIPTSFGSNGQSDTPVSTNNFDKLFDTKRLGKGDVLVKTGGKSYTGIPVLKEKIASLVSLEKEMADTKNYIASSTIVLESKKNTFSDLKTVIETAAKNRDYDAYKENITKYNASASEYQATYKSYQDMVNLYNKDVKTYNELLKVLEQNK